MTSYGEKLLRMYVKRCFPGTVQKYNCRDTGIKNPETGCSLEIDIYLPSLKIGFEFHGRQHRTDTYQREKDRHKRKQCSQLGITLFEIWTATLTADLYSLIKEKTGGIKELKKPPADFLIWFKEKAEGYKKDIYSMNKTINSDKFVRRRKKCRRL